MRICHYQLFSYRYCWSVTLVLTLMCSSASLLSAAMSDLLRAEFNLQDLQVNEGFSAHTDGSLVNSVNFRGPVTAAYIHAQKGAQQIQWRSGKPLVYNRKMCTFLFHVGYNISKQNPDFSVILKCHDEYGVKVPGHMARYEKVLGSKESYLEVVPLEVDAQGNLNALWFYHLPKEAVTAALEFTLSAKGTSDVPFMLYQHQDTAAYFKDHVVQPFYYELVLEPELGIEVICSKKCIGDQVLLSTNDKTLQSGLVKSHEDIGSVFLPINELNAESKDLRLSIKDQHIPVNPAYVPYILDNAFAQIDDDCQKGLDWAKKHKDDYKAGYVAYLAFEAKRQFEQYHDSYFEFYSKLTAVLKKPQALKPGQLFEWAYLSKTDNSGQPFTLGIPAGYSTEQRYPLLIRLHGGGGTHNPPAVETAYHESYVTLRLLGRSRTGSYIYLSESDILEALRFVKQHVAIDDDQVFITGGSMGGWGSMRMVTRYPHIFAAAKIECGCNYSLFTANAKHVPLATMHSTDDWAHTIGIMRIGNDMYKEAGGNLLEIERTGFGHGIAKDKEAAQAASAFMFKHKRAQSISDFSFSAVDERARRAYWAAIEKWGPRSSPAHFQIKVVDNNLHVTLENIDVLRLDLKDAPIDRTQEYLIHVNAQNLGALTDPLADVIYLSNEQVSEQEGDNQGYTYKAAFKTEGRLHCPGGMASLYTDEPLLIVYGTGGDEQIKEAVAEVVPLIQASTKPNWAPKEKSDAAQRLSFLKHNAIRRPRFGAYTGLIPAKSDMDVTASDISDNNLIIVGTPENNRLLNKMMNDLPLEISKEKVSTSDGSTFAFAGKGLGLLYKNPQAADKLIYVIASYDRNFYRGNTPLLHYQNWDASYADFMISSNAVLTMHARRNFNADWEWEVDYKHAPKVPNLKISNQSFSGVLAPIIQQASKADFVLMGSHWGEHYDLFEAGVSTWWDVTGDPHERAVISYDVRGEQLLLYAQSLLEMPPNWLNRETLKFFPAIDAASIDADKTYRISCVGWDFYNFEATVKDPKMPRPQVLDKTYRQILREHAGIK